MMANFKGLSGDNSELAKQTSETVDGINSKALVLSFMEKNKKKETKTKIKYAKEFFVTEKGEIIKMAAVISTNPEVLAEL